MNTQKKGIHYFQTDQEVVVWSLDGGREGRALLCDGQRQDTEPG